MTKLILSNSRISCFRDCRKKYHFKYDEGLRPKAKSGKLLLGSGIHKGVQEYFRLLSKVGPGRMDNIEEIKGVMNNRVAKYYKEERKKLQESGSAMIQELENEMDIQEQLSYAMVDNFLLEWNDKATKMFIEEVVEIEQEHTVLVGSFNGIEVWYKFIPDMVVRMNGKLWIPEIKTVKSIEFDSLRRDDQGRSYVWGYGEHSGENVEGIIYLLLRKQKNSARVKTALTGKSPFYVTQLELRSFKDGLDKIAAEMTKGDYAVYRSSSMDCSWKCPYQYLCYEDNEEVRKAEFDVKKG